MSRWEIAGVTAAVAIGIVHGAWAALNDALNDVWGLRT